MAKLEEGLVVKMGPAGARCPTGEAYIAFGTGGTKPEGAAMPGQRTEDIAVRYWLKYALEYKIKVTKEGREGFTLYWRTPLETAHDPREDGPAIADGVCRIDKQSWYAYGRFIITNKPEK